MAPVSPALLRSTAPVVLPCGTIDYRNLAPTMPLDGNGAPHVVAGAGAHGVTYGGVSALALHDGKIYVLDIPGHQVKISLLSGVTVATIPVSWPIKSGTMAVGPDGEIYLSQYPYGVVRLTPTGATVWTRQMPGEVDALFADMTPRGFMLGVVVRGQDGSLLFDANGNAMGRSQITGRLFSQSSDGRMVATDDSYVRIYDAQGHLRHRFGAAPTTGSAAFHFHQLGAALLLPEGTVYIADGGHGIEKATSDGLYLGLAPDSSLGMLTEASALWADGDRIYFANGGPYSSQQQVAWITRADLEALIGQAKAPQPILGFGAGVTSSAIDGYFAPGRTPSASIVLDPWWLDLSTHIAFTYDVRERDQVLSGANVPAHHLTIPDHGTRTMLPLSLPPAEPGSYEVNVNMRYDNRLIGSSCLYYSVGASGDQLDLSSLPDAPDYGGPTPVRAVALAHALGITDVRANIDWQDIMPSASAPLDFSRLDKLILPAAYLAAQDHVTFHVQVGQGNPPEKSLVSAGMWGERVRQLVAHYRGIVHYWEAWNEPNNTFGSGEQYVSQVLKPFYAAVKTADPAAQVIGGSVLGLDLAYWQAIGAAGGFRYMDVLAIHPYTGNNRSFEEEGTMEAVNQLQSLVRQFGAGNKPIWVTEMAWWSDGPGNLYRQANVVTRAKILLLTHGITTWNYFIIEGGYGSYGVSDSLIQYVSPDEPRYVKPAVLALMTEQAQVGARRYQGFVPTGIPHTFAVRFGGSTPSDDAVYALWSDDLAVNVNVATVGRHAPTDPALTDELGRSHAWNANTPLRLDGSVWYIRVPAGVRLDFNPGEPFGPNLATAATGARASASSSAPSNAPEMAISGNGNAGNGGIIFSSHAWVSAVGDSTPTFSVSLAHDHRIDRILISTHSPGSIVPTLRTFQVQVTDGDRPWTTVAIVRDNFYNRNVLVQFSPRQVRAIRLVVYAVDYGGDAGGGKPWYWPIAGASRSSQDQTWYGPAVLYSLEAYAAQP